MHLSCTFQGILFLIFVLVASVKLVMKFPGKNGRLLLLHVACFIVERFEW